MITHTVAFRLKQPQQIQEFLKQAAALASIAGVDNFQILQQVGKKNDFTHALSMVFRDQSFYDSYNAHPDHQRFVNTVWIPSVADFMELDYVQLG